MENSSNSRRVQFSSCDACRQARVACDAAKTGRQPGERQWAGSCTRCVSRNQTCTFEWIIETKRTPLHLRRYSKSQRPLTTAASFVPWEPPDQASTPTGREASTRMAEKISPHKEDYPRATSFPSFTPESERTSADSPISTASPSANTETADILLTRWSDQIFHQGFGTIFGHRIGKNGCPLVNEPSSDVNTPPISLFCSLDTFMDEQLSTGSTSQPWETSRRRLERDSQISQSLQLALKSYAARWLPVVTQSNSVDTSQVEETVRRYWRATRRDMLKVINRISYRSVLTLYLFGQTPIPVGIAEEEELDGITGVVCTQTALLQIQQLRGRLRSCQYDGSEMSTSSGPTWSSALAAELKPAFLALESRAYWAAVTWDTSNSATLNLRSTLSTGLRGACLEPAWVLARGFLVESFHPKTKEWRKIGFEVSDEVATEIISAADICRLYVWRTIASLKEALREGVDEDSVLFAWRAFLDGLDVFKVTIRPLLDNCERSLDFLSQVNRFRWYEAILHYYLGILMLLDAVETAGRPDLLSQLAETKLEAEQESFKVLRFGLEGTYSIYMPWKESESATNFACSGPHPPGWPTVTTSFVAMDPYPHHVVASVQLMNRAISRKYRQGNIKYDTYVHLSSTLLKALEQLPQSSKSVRSARDKLQRSIHELCTNTSVAEAAQPR